MKLGEDHRNILRQSLSNMKQAWQENEVMKQPVATPKPKIVCPVLYQNTIASRSHAALQPRIILNAETLKGTKHSEEIKAVVPKPIVKKEHSKRVGLDGLLERLQKLDAKNIERIELLLKELEKSGKGEERLNITKNPKLKKRQLVFKIISTWGHPYVAGLTEIELYDAQGKLINTPLTAKNLGDGPTQPTSRLTNGKVFVNDEEYMWVAYLPLSPKVLELIFPLPLDCVVGGLAIWNYNKNSNDSVKGVKDAEVIVDGKIVWSGIIKRGNGRINEDYSTEILLCKNEEVFKARKQELLAIDSKDVEEGKEDVIISQETKPALPDRFTKISTRKKFTAKNNEPKLAANIKQVTPQKEQTIEHGMDSLLFFEVTKPQRLLRKESAKETSTIEPKLVQEIEESNGDTKGNSFNPLKTLYETNASFSIPELPKGRVLKLELLSTWDDPHYIGLAGIEIFIEDGLPLKIPAEGITAQPKDINILPEYGSDPRTVDKLVDGTYFTSNDLHVWLAPYTEGMEHYVMIDMGKVRTISMIRVWNYNKSRIHSERGVRDMVITLDNKIIFMGEIKKAPGMLSDLQKCCEVILFTTNESIINQISKNDWIEFIEIEESYIEPFTEERPHTASKRYTEEEIKEFQKVVNQVDNLERPLTTATILKPKKTLQPSPSITGKRIVISIIETWGDFFYAGLTGLEVYDEYNQQIKLTIGNISSNPKDLNSIPGHGGDYRTIDKLIDGVNDTTDDKHMWLIPYNRNKSQSISIELPRVMKISGLRFYNYNKSLEDANRGVKLITIVVDNRLATPKQGVIVRKANGSPNQYGGHLIKLPYTRGWTEAEVETYYKLCNQPIPILQEYNTPLLPTGFTFQFFLYSTYGDIHYIGLNGLEMYDLFGHPILQDKAYSYTIRAIPSSVKELPGLENDIRTLDKLTDGVNETLDDRNMWLTSMQNTKLYALTNREVSKKPNVIIVTFEEQVVLSAVRIWNYAKTPSRGVQELAIFCDGKVIYRVIICYYI